MRIWYLVADGARARLFQADGWNGDLEEIEEFTNETGRLRNQDLDRDKPGRSNKSGSRRTAMDDGDSAEREEARFAKRLAEHVNEAFQDGDFDKLGIVAAPKALGNIREHLRSDVEDVVAGTSPKNLTKANLDDIAEHVERNIA